MEEKARDISYKAGEIYGQAQAKKDDLMNEASKAYHEQRERDYGSSAAGLGAFGSSGSDPFGGPKDSTYTSQSNNFLQQAGEQLQHMAQGAAEAVKSTLGMNNEAGRGHPGSDVSGFGYPNDPNDRSATRF